MKILIFCSDLLPYPGLPTSGGGLRGWQLIESLRAAGHEVVASMPLFTFLARRFAERIAPEARELAWDQQNQDELVERIKPDAILFTSSWTVDHLRRDPPCLRIYDLDGPQLLEMQYQGRRNVAAFAAAKIERLSKADFVFCAGRRQRWYFFPFLQLAGFEIEDLDDIPVIPIARPEPLPQHLDPSPRIEFVSGGGFYPWQDPWATLHCAAEAIGWRAAECGLRIVGANHGVHGDDDQRFARLQANLTRFSNVTFHGFLPHAELLEVYRTSSVAIELHVKNPERELAFTTRTVDCLWSGLPVLYNDYGELSEWIAEYDAGWTVDPSNLAAVRRTIEGILAAPAQIALKGANAQRLARERLIYSRTIGPLAEFLRNPTRRAGSAAALVVPATWYSKLARRAFRAARKLRTMPRRRTGATP